MKAIRSGVVGVAFVLLTGSLAGAQVPSGAAWEQAFGPGSWNGVAFVGGTAEASVDGLDLSFGADITGIFLVVVPTSGDGLQLTSGFMEFGGPWTMDIDGMIEGRSFKAKAVMRMGGEADIQGEPTGPAVTDIESQSTGSLTVSIDDVPLNTTDLSSPDSIKPLPLEVVAVACDEAHGTWTLSWRAQLEELGWDPAFSGSWTALRREKWGPDLTDETLAAIGAWLAKDPLRVETLTVGGAGFRDLLTFLAEGERIINALRNLSSCGVADAQTIRQWISVITGRIQLFIGEATAFRLEPAAIALLLSIGLRSGALGPGSLFPESAAATERLLRQDAQEIVDRYIRQDGSGQQCFAAVEPGCLLVAPEVWSIIAVASQAGWPFTVDGTTMQTWEIVADGVVTR